MRQFEQEYTVSTINEIHESDSVDQIVASLTAYVKYFGFESLSITHLISPIRSGKKRIAISDWPQEFLDKRFSKNTIIHDPIAHEAMRSKTPFTWGDVYERADKNGRLIIEEAREYTSKDGLLIPVHPYDSVPGCISLGTNKVDLSREQLSWLDVVSVQAFMKIVEILGPFPFEMFIKLTGREIDVVHYAAAGKTNWEISRILNISEHTVRSYFQTAARKLNTISRTHTVAVALANKLILL